MLKCSAWAQMSTCEDKEKPDFEEKCINGSGSEVCERKMVFESKSRSLKKKTAAVEKMVYGKCVHQVDVYIYKPWYVLVSHPQTVNPFSNRDEGE